jgi:hypothetical protein
MRGLGIRAGEVRQSEDEREVRTEEIISKYMKIRI